MKAINSYFSREVVISMLKKKYLIWLLPTIWLGITFFLTFQSGDSSGRLSHIIAGQICAIFGNTPDPYTLEMTMRDIAHFGIHFVLAFLTALAAYYDSDDAFRPGMLAFFLCIAVGLIDEIGQIIIPGRFFEPIDIARNLLGVLYGTACFIFVYSFKKHFEAAHRI